MAYGFIYNNLQTESVSLDLQLTPDDPLIEDKTFACMYSILQTFHVKKDLKDPETANFLAFSRFIVLRPEDKDKIGYNGFIPRLSK